MSGYGVINTTASNEMACATASVEIAGTVRDWTTCVTIEKNAGIQPSKAIIHIGGGNYDVTGPITLNAYEWPFRKWARVKITVDRKVLFLGHLMKRRDQGQPDSIVWEAWDDRWLLTSIPVRGCFVLDAEDGDGVKFISAYVPRMNPAGAWNCVGGVINGVTYPVFTPYAQYGKTYEAPDEVFNPKLEAGKLVAWTPRFALQYWQLCCNVEAGDVDGVIEQDWRHLKNSTRLVYNADATSMVGKDPAQALDPMDRKMPDTSFRGERMLGALVKTLHIAGTHDLTLYHVENKSFVQFFPTGLSFVNKPEGDGEYARDINLHRGGNAITSGVDTAYDFDLVEDASRVAESALVEGKRIHAEGPLEYDLTTTTALQPAWTSAEETAFRDGVKGDGTYANYPSQQDSTEVDLLADGQDGRQFARATTEEAIALLRQAFPRVFKAFRVDSNNALGDGLTAGANAEYNDTTEYPLLLSTRPILPTQLQYFLKDPTGAADIQNRLFERYPIRVQVYASGDTAYKDVPFNNGIRVGGDGLIWLDGLAEDSEGLYYCVYDGALKIDPDNVTMRKIKLNAAIPYDHRVKGYGQIKKGQSVIDPAMRTELGGPLLTYADSPDAYAEDHQFNSSPTPNTQYIQADEFADAPLTRILPPGSEAPHAAYAATRVLWRSSFQRRMSTWKLVGIRPDYDVGVWVGKVAVNGGPSGDRDYDVNAPILNITYDFMNQVTTIGGLLSQVSENDSTVGKSERVLARARAPGTPGGHAEQRSFAARGAGATSAPLPAQEFNDANFGGGDADVGDEEGEAGNKYQTGRL